MQLSRGYKPVCKISIKSNQIKSLLLSHHHSTSALVSEILMSVLQTVQKNNRQFTYGQTVQKKQQTIYIWTDSAKKNNKQFTYGQTVQKKQQTIYIWTDSAKKLHWSIYSAPDSAKKKQQQQFTYGQTVQKNNSNLHMDRLKENRERDLTFRTVCVWVKSLFRWLLSYSSWSKTGIPCHFALLSLSRRTTSGSWKQRIC